MSAATDPIVQPAGKRPKPIIRRCHAAVSPTIHSPARLLNAAGVCAFLALSGDTLDRLVADPDERFPVPIRIGALRHWTLGSLEKYVQRKLDQAEREHRQ